VSSNTSPPAAGNRVCMALDAPPAWLAIPHAPSPNPPNPHPPNKQTATDYGSYLANEASPLFTSTIVDRCTRKLVEDWTAMRCQADEKLARFLDFCTYGHMIDNVVLIVTGTLHERDVQVGRGGRLFVCLLGEGGAVDGALVFFQGRAARRAAVRSGRRPSRVSCVLTAPPPTPPLTPQELLDKCHPLGMFDSIATLAVAQNMRELYRLVLVDTPLAPYFSENLSHEDLDEMNIEIMRNTLWVIWSGRSGRVGEGWTRLLAVGGPLTASRPN
jgi:hypothetical protein